MKMLIIKNGLNNIPFVIFLGGMLAMYLVYKVGLYFSKLSESEDVDEEEHEQEETEIPEWAE